MTKSLRWLALGLGLGAAVWLYGGHDTEDFMYYYCKGWVENQGRSAYDVAAFQGCLARVLGRPNDNVSASLGSAYPPRSWRWCTLGRRPAGCCRHTLAGRPVSLLDFPVAAAASERH